MMELDRSYIVMALLASVVIASGCAGSDTESDYEVSQTKGVVIESFSADPSEVFEGQPVRMRMQVQNIGEREASELKATISNPPGLETGENGERSWGGPSGDIVRPQTTGSATLRPPSPDTERAGQKRNLRWSLTAPELSEGVSIPYTFDARLGYRYSTKGITNIEIMDSEEFRQSDAQLSVPTVDNSGGPIQLSVSTSSPIIFEGSDITKDLCVKAENTGSGTPIHLDSGSLLNPSEEHTNKIEVDVSLTGSKIALDESGNTEKTKDIILYEGGEGAKCFKLKPQETTDFRTTVPVEITANYGYMQETQTSVKVNGRR